MALAGGCRKSPIPGKSGKAAEKPLFRPRHREKHRSQQSESVENGRKRKKTVQKCQKTVKTVQNGVKIPTVSRSELPSGAEMARNGHFWPFLRFWSGRLKPLPTAWSFCQNFLAGG